MNTDRLQSLRQAGIVAVLRAPSPDAALAAIDALVAGGITGLEVTYSTPDAPAVIAETLRRHPSAYVGAGTVRSAADAEAAVSAGAAFLVSPGTTPRVAAAMVATGVVSMTGALTPSETMTALEAGVEVVKLFPASSVGPAFLRALRAPFPEVAFMPTGGIDAAAIGPWMDAGAIALGAGGDLVPSSALAPTVDADELVRRAALFSGALRVWRTEADRG